MRTSGTTGRSGRRGAQSDKPVSNSLIASRRDADADLKRAEACGVGAFLAP